MNIENEKLYDVLNRINNLSYNHLKMWKGCFFLLIVCMVFDAVPYPYCATWLEGLFTYNIGNVIAIIVVVWTFTVSLSTYCLDKLGKRYYGVPMSSILLIDLKKGGILALAGMVLTELFSLILAAILEWEITIVMIAVQQFFIMIYLFLLVCVKTSYAHVLEQINVEMERYISRDMAGLVEWIKEEGNDKSAIVRKPMLFTMIRNLDYADVYSSEELLKVLKRNSKKLAEIFQKTEQFNENQDERKMLKLQKNIIMFSKRITLDIIGTAKTKENILYILYGWMKTEGLRFEIKQGIIEALYEELTPQNVSICQSLIKVEQEYQRELQIWGAVYNVFMQEYTDEEWRVTYTEQLFKALRTNWKQKDVEMALKYWRYIYEWEGMYAPLFRYLF